MLKPVNSFINIDLQTISIIIITLQLWQQTELSFQ